MSTKGSRLKQEDYAVADKEETIQQFYDHFVQRMAIAMFLTSVLYAMSAIEDLAANDLAGWLDFLDTPMSIVIAIVLIPSLLKMIWLRRHRKNDCAEADSFVADAFKNASSKAFIATFLSLTVMRGISEKMAIELSASFYLNVTLSITLAVCSLVFLYSNRDIAEDDDFDLENDA